MKKWLGSLFMLVNNMKSSMLMLELTHITYVFSICPVLCLTALFGDHELVHS